MATVRIVCDRCGSMIGEQQCHIGGDDAAFEVRAAICRKCLDDAYRQGVRVGMRLGVNVIIDRIGSIRSQLDEVIAEEIRDKAHGWKLDYF